MAVATFLGISTTLERSAPRAPRFFDRTFCSFMSDLVWPVILQQRNSIHRGVDFGPYLSVPWTMLHHSKKGGCEARDETLCRGRDSYAPCRSVRLHEFR